MQGMLEPDEVETPLGQAEVRQLFSASRIGTIAGCFVLEGMVTRGAACASCARAPSSTTRRSTACAASTRTPARSPAVSSAESSRRLPGPQGRRRPRDLRDPSGRARARRRITRRANERPRGSRCPGRDRRRGGELEGRMSTGRMRRVDEAIRQVLGDAFGGELKDPRVGFVTVTDVRTSPDLRHARVYFSVLGRRPRVPRPDREDSHAGLGSAHGFLQSRLAPSCASSARRPDFITTRRPTGRCGSTS